MAVTKQIPIKIYPHADGTTKTFPFDFQLINVTDLDVRLGGQSQTSGYTVDIQNNQGGNVVFTTAPAKDIEVMLRRATPFQRDTDYQDNGDLLADTLDDDLDRIWLALQEQQAATDIVISRPVGGDSWDARNLQIGNLLAGVDNNDAATVGQVRTLNGDTVAASLDAANSKREAAASAAAALASQNAAAASQTAAKTSETNAAASAASMTASVTAAAGSATAAAASASAALASQNAAKASENSTSGVAAAALASQNAAAGSATAAAASAKTASDAATATAGSVAAASTSAANASASATAAAGSATAADASADESARTAGLSAGSATAAAGSATAAKTSETNAAASAAAAATANPDNQLKKAQNLADLADKSAARVNLALDRISQADNSQTYVFSGDKTKKLLIDNAGNWGAWNNTIDGAIPLAVASGGTGATTADAARTNLGLRRFQEFPNETIIKSPDDNSYITISNNDDWGCYSSGQNKRIPLPIQSGGTGATTAADARKNLGLGLFGSDNQFTTMTDPSNKYQVFVRDTGDWGCVSPGSSRAALPVISGGTGATDAAGARANLGALYRGGDSAINQMETKLTLATNPGGSILGYSWRSAIEAANVGTATADFYVNHTVGGVTYACIKPTRVEGTSWEFHFSDFGEISNISGLVVNRNTGITGEASGNLSLNYGASQISQYASRMDFVDTSARAVLNIYDNTRLVTVAPTAGVICKKGYSGDVQNYSYGFAYEGGGVDVYIDSSRIGRIALDPTSDIDYKEDIQDWDGESALDNIDAMELVTFKFKADEKQRTRRGVIAQQLETIDPEYVHHGSDQDDKPILSLDTNVLLLDALAAIKVLNARVKELEEKLAA